ncbi:MAG: biotin attachment protein [Spirochaetaceae bacterium]|nr:MAG: biotin attachment protein [Spirochaetaceae bacterium]
MKKLIKFMNTGFRDGFQSVFGARVFTEDFLPAVEAARHAGIMHHEIGGGARFQSLYFYCNEDAFAMHDSVRAAAGPEANLQTLARGINVVGLDSQPRDIIKLHAELFKKHSITTVRNFDALNDVENLVYSGRCISEAGLKHEVCVTLMELPPDVEGAHTAEFYLQMLRQILDAEIPFDSVCFKDASGTSVPSKVYDTIKGAREMLGKDVHITFHTHETAGVSISQYMAALDAGVDQIDLSMAPVSGGTCQPDIVTMWHALRGTEYDLGINIQKVIEAEEVFRECMSEYFVPPEAIAVEPVIPFSPMPGGALTANTQMLRDNNLLHRFDEVIRNMGEVISRGGFGTSVTPVSQFYFQQAFNNVMLGPWKRIAEGYGKMVLGYYGKTPVPPDPEVVKLASEQLGLEPTTESPLDINERDPKKGMEAARSALTDNDIPISEENIFIAATCKEKGIAFLAGKGRLGVRKNGSEGSTARESGGAHGERVPVGNHSGRYSVTINSHRYEIDLKGQTALVNGQEYQVAIQAGAPGPAGSHPVAGGHSSAGELPPDTTAAMRTDGADEFKATLDLKAPMSGLVLRMSVAPGASVNKGDEIIVLEAMKMETPVESPVRGIVTDVFVETGDQVAADSVLLRITH